MLPAVAAAVAAFAFFFEGCTPQKPKSASTRGQHGEQKDRYVEPRLDPMDKYDRYRGSFGPGHRW